MIDLRNYESLIRERVAKEDERDKNWKWSVQYIGKKTVSIRWGYLTYCGEKKSCFHVKLESNSENDNWIWATYPDGEIIECYMVTEGDPNPKIGAEMTVRSAIKSAIDEIAYIAHSRY